MRGGGQVTRRIPPTAGRAIARASGKAPAPFWEGWSRLRKEYDRRLPA